MKIEAIQPIDIFSLLPEERTKGYDTTGAKPIYGVGITLIGDPSTWSRKQKLAYIETEFAKHGEQASKDRFITECMLSRGLAYEVALLAKAEGLRIHERNKNK